MCRACPTVSESEWTLRPATRNAPEVRLVTGSSEFVVWYDEYDEERDRHRVGGKNASLGTMMGAGLPVPPGFAVTTNAYDTLRNHEDLTTLINDLIGGIDFDNPTGLQAVSDQIRTEIEKLAVPGEIEEAVFSAYEQLCQRCGVEDVGVAVRSSATAEDLPDASFAGQQDTYLWVHGADNVLAHVAKCWSSMFTDRAMAYRHEMGFDDQAIAMSVGVQKMVDPRASGVAFTLNPLTGDRTQVAIDASWGLGEAVVSGEVTPDNYLVDKVLREVVGRIISDKHIEIRRTDTGVETIEVEAERRTSQCITDAEICDVAAMARRAEKHYGCPQDVEWALDRHLPDGENIVLLQARPETVWSQKARTSVSRGTYDPLGSIVSTLTSPLKADKAT